MKKNIAKAEEELDELGRVAEPVTEPLTGRDFELTKIRQEQEEELKEMDRIAKMLVRRDFELSQIRAIREKELEELEQRTQELNNSRRALMNILEDVEETRALAERERDRTLAIINNFADGLIVLDKESKVLFLNPRAEEFFRITAKEVEGKPIAELKSVPCLKPALPLMMTSGRIRRVSRQEFSPEKETIHELTVIPLIEKGEEKGYLAIFHDISREKVIERLKSEFVSLSAHQLRTPLSAIKWTLRMLLDGDLGKVPEDQKEMLEKTYQSNERMIRLINDLLNVARIEEGRFLYRAKKEDIVALIQKTIIPLKEMAQRRGLSFNFEEPKTKVPKVSVDAERIVLALQNLTENAIRYTESGEVKVSLKYQEKKKEFLFEIHDSGIGIPEDQQKRVFAKFFRAANAIKTETQGTGLGLFIAKNIIEAHGGAIWFKSQEGKGSTFYFTLPVGKD